MSNPYLVEQSAPYDIEGTLGNVTFALSSIQHTLKGEGGEPIELSYEVAQGNILAIQGMIAALEKSSARVELMRDTLIDPVQFQKTYSKMTDADKAALEFAVIAQLTPERLKGLTAQLNASEGMA